MRWKTLVGLGVLAITVAACGGRGGGGGGFTPTAPTGRGLFIAVGIANSNFANTIQEVNLSFDGKVVFTFTSQQAVSLASLTGQIVSGVAPGPHTVGVTMVRQTRSPSTYNFLGGGEVDVNDITTGSLVTVIRLPDQVSSMATGQAVNFAISVP